jgi:hypothetical protein
MPEVSTGDAQPTSVSDPTSSLMLYEHDAVSVRSDSGLNDYDGGSAQETMVSAVVLMFMMSLISMIWP